MYKDIPVAAFVIAKGFFSGMAKPVINKNAISLLPFGANNIPQLVHWFSERSIPLTREGLNDYENSHTIRLERIIQNLALSLTDSYWIKPVKSDLNWDRVNLFKNDFEDKNFFDVIEESKQKVTEYSPNSTLNGDMAKKWIVDKTGVRCLTKVGKNKSIQQALNEIIATKFHLKQNMNNFVPYKLIKVIHNDRSTYGCSCPNAIKEGEQITIAYDVVKSEKVEKNTNWITQYKKIANSNGIDSVELDNFLSYMILSDFVLSNSDRHYGNFGLIWNTELHKFTKIMPIYDTGTSLFYSEDIPTTLKGLLKLEVNGIDKKEVNSLRHVTDRSVLDLNALLTNDELFALINQDIHLKEERKQDIIQAYQKKCKLISDFQNGMDLWKYPVQQLY